MLIGMKLHLKQTKDTSEVCVGTPRRWRKIMKLASNSAGFTLIEIMLVMVILSLILTMAGGMFFDIFRTKKTVEEQQLLSSTVLSFYNQIEKKVKWAQAITSISGSSFIFTDDTGNHHEIEFSDEKILDNGMALTPENVRVKSFNVEDLSPDPDLPSLKFTLDLQSKEIETHELESSFVLSVRRKDVAAL